MFMVPGLPNLLRAGVKRGGRCAWPALRGLETFRLNRLIATITTHRAPGITRTYRAMETPLCHRASSSSSEMANPDPALERKVQVIPHVSGKGDFSFSFTASDDAAITLDALLDTAKTHYPGEPGQFQTIALNRMTSPFFWSPGSRVSIVDLECRGDLSPTELAARIKDLDGDSTCLVLADEPPYSENWAVLAEKFPKVKRVLVSGGFGEVWTDKGFPETWNLDVLMLGCVGDFIASPHILQGGVGTLVLDYPMWMHFKDIDATEEAADVGADLDWQQQSGARRPGSATGQGSLRSLAFIGNEALNMLIYLYKDRPDLARNLVSLSVHSTHLNFSHDEERKILNVLPKLVGLETLRLWLCKMGPTDAYEDVLDNLPQGIEELHFNGPPVADGDTVPPSAIAYRDGYLQAWIDKFTMGEALPQLKRLDFVCGTGMGKRESRSGCELEQRVWSAARKRGVELIHQPPDLVTSYYEADMEKRDKRRTRGDE